MVRKIEKQILLAMDGSDYAFETAKYISHIRPFQQMNTVLFNVFSKIPECYWDMEKEPQYRRRLSEIRFWEMHRHQELQEYMANARQIFLEAGFAEKAVTVKMQERDRGIA